MSRACSSVTSLERGKGRASSRVTLRKGKLIYVQYCTKTVSFLNVQMFLNFHSNVVKLLAYLNFISTWHHNLETVLGSFNIINVV